MHEKIDKLIKSKFGVCVDKFCNTPFYAAAIAAVCILCHSLDIPIVGAALLMLLLVPALLFCNNSYVLAPFFMMCSFVISVETMPQSGYYATPERITVLCLLLSVGVAALFFNFVYYGKWRKIFKRAYLTVSMALVTAVLIVGGFLSETYALNGIWMSVAIGATMFFPYALMVNCGVYEGRKTVEYIAWSLIAAAVVIAAAVLKQYILFDFEINMWNKGVTLMFGHSISNTAAAIVVLAIPATFYFIYKYRYGCFFMLLVAFELFVIFKTFSRASIIVSFPFAVIIAIVLCFLKKNGRLAYYITFGVATVMCIIFAAVYWDTFCAAVDRILGDDGDSGRFHLWKIGLDVWTEHPVFGTGLWYLIVNNVEAFHYYSFHCTPLTYLYCAGIIGLAAYLYHRYRTVRLVFMTKPTAERVFFALSIAAMLVNALLDIAMTSPPHLLYYSIIFAVIESDVRAVKSGGPGDKKEIIEQNTDTAELPQSEPETESAT